MAIGGRPYQFFVAPVRAPEIIGYVAMGFAVDDTLAKRMSALVGAEISLVASGAEGKPFIASTLQGADREALMRMPLPALHGAGPRHLSLGSQMFLSVSRDLPSSPDVVAVLVQRPMHAVLAPYRDVRDAMFAIGTLALLAAVGVGLLAGRSASRPIAALVKAAQRIEEGRYESPVFVRGAREFRRLASTLNAMQTGIADRENRITHLAYHDALTGLPNRAYAEIQLDGLLKDDGETPLSLILVDVRNLPDINATLGHHTGDAALIEVARRLRQNLGHSDLVARLSAHQFMVVSRPCSLRRAPLLAEQLTGTIRAGFHVAQVSLDMDAIAGIAAFPDHSREARELLRCAQLALHDADSTRSRVALYVAGRDEQHRRRLTLLTELRLALENDGLQLVYQPKVEMGMRTVKSVEALARWTHPCSASYHPRSSFRSPSRLATCVGSRAGCCVPRSGRWRSGGATAWKSTSR